MTVRQALGLLCLFLAIGAMSGCAQETEPLSAWLAAHAGPASDASTLADAGAPIEQPECRQAHAESLPQRLVTMSASDGGAAELIYVTDLYTRFTSICGACHGFAADAPGQGGFRIASPSDFTQLMTPAVLAHVMSDGPSNPSDPTDPSDPLDPMPPFASPAGEPFSSRSATDAVREFAVLVQAWLAAGSPAAFPDPTATTSPGASDAGSYRLTPATATAMTNIGDCVPNASMVATASLSKQAADLDTMFASLSRQPPGAGVTPAQLIGLPEHLSQTDLIALDATTLAQYGVIAYQPAYPLWSDNAGKLRYVRVPIGQSIHLDKATQTFTIPDNTRFYKTFMKPIYDTDGSRRWRKMETRLIVARHDTQNADGSAQNNALFGSYRWSDDESDAVLQQTPLNDGLPFADELFLYNTDEQLAADVLAQNPGNPDLALVSAGAARHYAIPSSDRCVECHMGSASETFVLGFLPLQVSRRPQGQGGILMLPGEDELTQLQRFIDYGLITGLSSPADVLPLEQSESARLPRNQSELVAQGYMLGNCAHCHNPRGYPTVTNPVLAGVLDMLPRPDGGIFQFPLDRFSPRIARGPGAATPIPYITPSLTDLSESQKVAGTIELFAPWRSLIYRATDTPFPYTDDNALFPHMPMNTAGFDCQAKQVMSDWMVSIPAMRKNPQLPEYPDTSTSAKVDDAPQPYVEVPPGAPGYDQAAQDANRRLAILHTGLNPAINNQSSPFSEYAYCIDTSDILDPAVNRDPTCHPVPTPAPVIIDSTPITLSDVPGHAHWVVTDLTEVAGIYSPRRTDWANILISQNFPAPELACSTGSLAVAQQDQDEVKLAVDVLQTTTLDQVRSFETQSFPMGLWQSKPECDLASQPTVASFTGGNRARWMDNPAADASGDSPVYAEWPGAAVFNMICTNCHGPLADAHGRLADNLLIMTGGSAQVADLRDGLFGPVTSPGANRQEAFGSLPAGIDAGSWANLSADDRAARYLAWMASGGTEVVIPQSIIQIVGTTSVLGVPRVLPAGTVSANMLSVAKTLCLSLLFSNIDPGTIPGGRSGVGADKLSVDSDWFTLDPTGIHLKEDPDLISSNGDAELWLKLCSIGNPAPIRAVHGSKDSVYSQAISVDVDNIGRLFSLDLFPADPSTYGANPVGNDRGTTDASGLTSDNVRPWCYRASSSDASEQPQCPPSIDDGNGGIAEGVGLDYVAESGGTPVCTNGCWGPNDADRWATRGAINAGLAVFLYLDGVAQGTTVRLPDYTDCQDLP
jgi:mono/diheme cytochrome c family protein